MIFLHLLQNQQSWICLLFIASDATDATWQLAYSFENIGIHAFALLFIASDATGATLGLPDNQPYSLSK